MQGPRGPPADLRAPGPQRDRQRAPVDPPLGRVGVEAGDLGSRHALAAQPLRDVCPGQDVDVVEDAQHAGAGRRAGRVEGVADQHHPVPRRLVDPIEVGAAGLAAADDARAGQDFGGVRRNLGQRLQGRAAHPPGPRIVEGAVAEDVDPRLAGHGEDADIADPGAGQALDHHRRRAVQRHAEAEADRVAGAYRPAAQAQFVQQPGRASGGHHHQAAGESFPGRGRHHLHVVRSGDAVDGGLHEPDIGRPGVPHRGQPGVVRRAAVGQRGARIGRIGVGMALRGPADVGETGQGVVAAQQDDLFVAQLFVAEHRRRPPVRVEDRHAVTGARQHERQQRPGHAGADNQNLVQRVRNKAGDFEIEILHAFSRDVVRRPASPAGRV